MANELLNWNCNSNILLLRQDATTESDYFVYKYDLETNTSTLLIEDNAGVSGGPNNAVDIAYDFDINLGVGKIWVLISNAPSCGGTSDAFIVIREYDILDDTFSVSLQYRTLIPNFGDTGQYIGLSLGHLDGTVLITTLAVWSENLPFTSAKVKDTTFAKIDVSVEGDNVSVDVRTSSQ
jgi:hypothetical protein